MMRERISSIGELYRLKVERGWSGIFECLTSIGIDDDEGDKRLAPGEGRFISFTRSSSPPSFDMAFVHRGYDDLCKLLTSHHIEVRRHVNTVAFPKDASSGGRYDYEARRKRGNRAKSRNLTISSREIT